MDTEIMPKRAGTRLGCYWPSEARKNREYESQTRKEHEWDRQSETRKKPECDRQSETRKKPQYDPKEMCAAQALQIESSRKYCMRGSQTTSGQTGTEQAQPARQDVLDSSQTCSWW
eukprot:362018-Chlamydomonas_euryale.AAC.22